MSRVWWPKGRTPVWVVQSVYTVIWTFLLTVLYTEGNSVWTLLLPLWGPGLLVIERVGTTPILVLSEGGLFAVRGTRVRQVSLARAQFARDKGDVVLAAIGQPPYRLTTEFADAIADVMESDRLPNTDAVLASLAVGRPDRSGPMAMISFVFATVVLGLAVYLGQPLLLLVLTVIPPAFHRYQNALRYILTTDSLMLVGRGETVIQIPITAIQDVRPHGLHSVNIMLPDGMHRVRLERRSELLRKLILGQTTGR